VILRTIRQLLLRGILGDRIFLNAALPQSDRDVLSRAVVSKLLVACREGVRPGIEGALSDARIYGQPWGFDLSEVTVPVAIWHGAMDSIVPARALDRWSSLNNVAINRMPEEGHYSIALRHSRRVIAYLAAHAGVATGATDDRCG